MDDSKIDRILYDVSVLVGEVRALDIDTIRLTGLRELAFIRKNNLLISLRGVTHDLDKLRAILADYNSRGVK